MTWLLDKALDPVYEEDDLCTWSHKILSLCYLGGAITDLTAVQTGLTTVQVTWTAPPGSPAGGYQITVAETSIDVTGLSGSPYIFNTLELGVHTVQVLYTSQHFPNEQAMPVMVTLEGEGDSIVVYITIMYGHSCKYVGIRPANITASSPTATSVTISLSLPVFSLPVVEYTVSLTRVTGSGQVLCNQVMHNTLAVKAANTISFAGLEEFSTYTVTVTTTFNVFGINMDVASDMAMFTTPSAGMYK